MSPRPPNQAGGLSKKIADIMLAVKHPPQSGYHQYHKYNYSTRDDIFGSIRGELASRGVAVLPCVQSVTREPSGSTTKRGVPMMRVTARVSVALIDSETGEEQEQVWEGEAHTDDDKGVQQAVTQALRFWATNTFMLLDGSDEQMYGQAGTQTSGTQDAAPPQRKAAPPTADELVVQIVNRLSGLEFSTEQTESFLDYIAASNGEDNIENVHRGKLQLWAQRMENGSDDDVRKGVVAKLRDHQTNSQQGAA